MRRRTISTLSAAAAVAALLLAPAAGQARPQVQRTGLKDHCIVKTLARGITVTVCYPT